MWIYTDFDMASDRERDFYCVFFFRFHFTKELSLHNINTWLFTSEIAILALENNVPMNRKAFFGRVFDVIVFGFNNSVFSFNSSAQTRILPINILIIINGNTSRLSSKNNFSQLKLQTHWISEWMCWWTL